MPVASSLHYFVVAICVRPALTITGTEDDEQDDTESKL